MSKIFVFDTNNLISAHLLTHSVNRKAYDFAFEKGILVCSTETLSEFTEVFTRTKFDKYISLESRLKAISIFENKVQVIEVTSTITLCRDPKDDKFLSLAVDSQADCIVTGDNDLLILHPYQNIPILTAYHFLSRF